MPKLVSRRICNALVAGRALARPSRSTVGMGNGRRRMSAVTSVLAIRVGAHLSQALCCDAVEDHEAKSCVPDGVAPMMVK